LVAYLPLHVAPFALSPSSMFVPAMSSNKEAVKPHLLIHQPVEYSLSTEQLLPSVALISAARHWFWLDEHMVKSRHVMSLGFRVYHNSKDQQMVVSAENFPHVYMTGSKTGSSSYLVQQP
jgi:hypothetical protein